MNWHLQSLHDYGTHRGYLRRGRVLAVCEVEFTPLRLWSFRGPTLIEPADPAQVCMECVMGIRFRLA